MAKLLPQDEAKTKLMTYNVAMLSLTEDELMAIASEVTQGMTHNEVADIVKRITGRETIVTGRGKGRPWILIAFEAGEDIAPRKGHELLYTA